MLMMQLSVPNIWLKPRGPGRCCEVLLSVPGGNHLMLLNVYNEYIQTLLQVADVHEQLVTHHHSPDAWLNPTAETTATPKRLLFSVTHYSWIRSSHSNGTTLLSPLLVHIWVYDAEILFLLLALPLAKC
ncbi:hypothetical protein CY34DRAFT_110607 [Suillus luteus UH-Slu-Lm8-n1]|uniref:Uncharacterized protein n=1 Tax=Suillus luteus UH-Slu-Lm8-n1 TaxID=930992 RepID=A0A0C9ZVX5_9AGAM|nr:hypothetical protein CY34DRAFT_110607 [Suillus luteus UH-Slu-Lm8-n1]